MRKFLITVNGKQYEVECEEVYSDGTTVQSVPSQISSAPAAAVSAVKPAEVKTEAPAAKPVSSGSVGSVKINAPMPGSIVKVNVNAGDSVKKGDCLVILEAMKMENEILAPQDGTVISVNTSKGSSVNAGDLLVSLD